MALPPIATLCVEEFTTSVKCMLQRSLDLYDRKHSRFADVVNGHVFGRKPHVVSHPLDTTALPHCEAIGQE